MLKIEHGQSVNHTVGVIGARGYVGAEIIRLIVNHPRLILSFASSRRLAGKPIAGNVTEANTDLRFINVQPAHLHQYPTADVYILALPNCLTNEYVTAIEETISRGALIIDMSADHRFHDSWTYGLPELDSQNTLCATNRIANPGCYATAVALALLPLADEGRLEGHVYVDAKSGVSGAGRAATATTHFCSAHDDVRPYKVGRSHRHVPEMEQTLRAAAGGGRCKLVFVPHLVPLERGMLATCAVYGSGLDESAAHELYRGRYRDEPFVEVLDAGGHARIRAVAHSNRAVISLHSVEEDDLLIVACAIDNLGKGAAGQAVQNANLLVGRPETEGLRA